MFLYAEGRIVRRVFLECCQCGALIEISGSGGGFHKENEKYLCPNCLTELGRRLFG